MPRRRKEPLCGCSHVVSPSTLMVRSSRGQAFSHLKSKPYQLKRCLKSIQMPSFNARSGCLAFKSSFPLCQSSYLENLHVRKQPQQPRLPTSNQQSNICRHTLPPLLIFILKTISVQSEYPPGPTSHRRKCRLGVLRLEGFSDHDTRLNGVVFLLQLLFFHECFDYKTP